jgi:hypothetical protein
VRFKDVSKTFRSVRRDLNDDDDDENDENKNSKELVDNKIM